MEFIITTNGIIGSLINGIFAFWLMRFAHKIVEDPTFEKNMFKRWDDKKLKRK